MKKIIFIILIILGIIVIIFIPYYLGIFFYYYILPKSISNTVFEYWIAGLSIISTLLVNIWLFACFIGGIRYLYDAFKDFNLNKIIDIILNCYTQKK